MAIRQKIKRAIRRSLGSNHPINPADLNIATGDKNTAKSLSAEAAKYWGIELDDLAWTSNQLRKLAFHRFIWLLPPAGHAADNGANNGAAEPLRFRVGASRLFQLLAQPAQSWRLICPLLEVVPTHPEPFEDAQQRPLVLDYLAHARAGEEMGGVLFDPDHLRRALTFWGQELDQGEPLLCHLAQLRAPLRQLISPHPLFECTHYGAQRLGLRPAAKATTQHPVLDYLIGSLLSERFRALEPSAGFNPCLWQRAQSHSSSRSDTLARRQQAPLTEFLAAMTSAKSSCPIGNRKLAGSVDGLDSEGVLRGWCKQPRLGQPAELEVWVDGLQLGAGVANQPRPDVAQHGIESCDCGFAIQLDLDQLSLDWLKKLNSLCWQVISNDGQLTLGRGDWQLSQKDRAFVAQALTLQALQSDDQEALWAGLTGLHDHAIAEKVREQIFRWCAVSAAAGSWQAEPLLLLQKAYPANSALGQGVEAESWGRAELILLALAHLQSAWQGNDNDGAAGVALAHQLAERCYFGPTARERQSWDTHVRPLFNVVIATLLLQDNPPDLTPTRPLLHSLIRIAEEVFGDLLLARTLHALLSDGGQSSDAAALRLQLRSGDALGVAIALFQQRRNGLSPTLKPFDQALALLEVSKQSLVTIETALSRLLPVILEQQARTPRISFCRRLLDELGWQVNTLAAAQIDDLVALGTPQALGLAVRERSIALLSRISQALWAGDNGRSGCTALPRSSRPPLRWLLIGEQGLPQCWLYRVEQKRQQLERCGAEVRCISKGDLDTWSFSQQILWADAVFFCRTPATYSVTRALTFARHLGKRVLADVDDLVFSTHFPAPYITYGGSISRSIHRRLQLDAPLQRWPLEQADHVITSTAALADACRATSDLLATKPITVLPNLPLPELLGLAKRLEHRPAGRPQRLVVSSGTLAHKQIWTEQLAPAIAQLLGSHAELTLSLIGHLELPACLQPFATRIRSVPYSDYSHYLQQLAEATIALVPLESHPTTDCKSAIKWMEASLLGLASVCSPVRAYTDAATAEEHLLLAEDQQAWVQQVERLLHNPELRDRLAHQARQQAQASFQAQLGEQIWSEQLLTPSSTSLSTPTTQRPKLLVINVFFAPQSFGGATRVAQDHVRELVAHHPDAYDVTVLCIDHDPWQDLAGDTLPLDIWHWHGARIVRLALPPRPWADIQDPRVEAFCREWFQTESFDRIHCHCTQVLTASPLLVARQLGIPYSITLHDAWWISPELFLVSPAGRLIDPAKPFDHIDGIPTPDEKAVALERRNILAGILQAANQRVSVSNPFKEVYERAGVEAIEVKENQFTPMPPPTPRPPRAPNQPLRVCHVGGMVMHKGYPILRQAVHQLPPGLKLTFTVIDHRLQEDEPPYTSTWNGYPVRFVAPVPMAEMADFYATQDVLVAPSIWPESFGLVTREAISSGLWVIASDIGALADPIQFHKNGTKIKPACSFTLAAAIQQYARGSKKTHHEPDL